MHEGPQDWSEATLRPPTLADPPRALAQADTSQAPPARIGRYFIVDELGSGGMGVVYSAYDPELDRKVAIKLMYSEVDRDRARHSQALLLREAQALARLSHPNIVAIHDVGVHAGQVFVAMEFVAGRTVRRWLDEAPRSWQEVLGVFVQAGRGLMAAHAAGLVHRDVKPDNLLVGDDDRVRVADFGVARFNAPDESAVTGEPSGVRPLATVAGRGALVGTPVYMAPEQHDNEGVGPHSDQFSFCVALYEALHGLRPFVGDSSADLVSAIRTGQPRRPPLERRGDARLPGWLERAVLRGLAADPQARWPSMQALLAVLGLEREARMARLRRRALWIALVVLGGVALYLGASALQHTRAREQAEQAAAERLKVVAASVDRLLARGRRAEAEEALRDFVGEPEHRSSRAASDAWLLWADRMEAAGERDAALTAVVEAYTGLADADPREPAIFLRIARLFRANWRFDELATLARHAGERWPGTLAIPEWTGLRSDAALAQRDLPRALSQLADHHADPQRQALVPLLQHLQHASTPTLAASRVHAIDLEGDGRHEIVTFTPGVAGDAIAVHAMDPALTTIASYPAHLTIENSLNPHGLLNRGPGQPAHLVGHRNGEIQLFELGPAGPRLVHGWKDDSSTAVAAADLDGDGLREFYVGTGSYTRKLHRLEPDLMGAWQRRPAHRGTDEIGSDINALSAGDFDGDGREELAVAVGPWRAYEVRILAAGADDQLEVAARWRLGHVRELTSLRGADGRTLLAIGKDNGAQSRTAFPASKPNGEPPGIYVVRRERDALVPVFFAPFPTVDGSQDVGVLRWMRSGDLDGDGLDDLILRYEAPSQRQHSTLLIFRQLPTGGFVMAQIGHTLPLAVGNFDADPASELLVQQIGEHDTAAAFAVLGVGDLPLAPVVPAQVVAAAPELADPVLARAWARAEHLVGFGLYTAAAGALERRIPLAQTAADGRRLQRRAAELHAAAGDHARAAAAHEALAQDGDIDAALAALADYEQALRLADALRLARALVLRDDLTPGQRQTASAAVARLADPVERRDAIDLRFDRPLAAGWQIAEPLALRLDRVDHTLAIDAFADTGDLMTLPIDLTGGPVAVELDLTIERAEWAAQLSVVIRREDGPELANLGVAAGGGGGFLRRYDIFSSADSRGRFDIDPWTAEPGERSQHLLLARLLPEQRMIDVEERADHPTRFAFAMTQTLAPGRHVLALRSSANDGYGALQIRAHLRRISLTGARHSDDVPPAPRARFARALVAGDWPGALQAAGDPLAGLWRAVAAAELGRIPAAIAALTALDPNDPALRRHLRHLLRAEPSRWIPLLRAAFGPRHAELLREALATATRMHLDDELRRVWLGDLADLDDLPEATPDQQGTKAELFTLRAAAWQAVGDLEPAARDLDTAAALRGLSLTNPAADDDPFAELELRRAQVAATRGNLADALAAAARALARASAPGFMAERLRIDPALQPLHADPQWLRMLLGH